MGAARTCLLWRCVSPGCCDTLPSRRHAHHAQPLLGYILDRAALAEVQPALGPAEIPVADGFFIGPRRAEEREGAMIFSNHSCDPNIGVQGQIVFVAMRDIRAGEELTHDWAMTDDDTYEMTCRCGAATCRGVVTGQDWRRQELQEKYGSYMSWYLLDKIRRGSP